MEKLYGLVVCGGQSTRMGTDKSLLEYHNVPQRYFLYHLLEPLCDKVFISCNAGQAMEVDEFYNIIIDKPPYSKIGPMAALLTACTKYPEASFLLVGCDYPFITGNYLKNLIDKREKSIEAVCFYNSETNFEEPLLAIYECGVFTKLLQYFKEGNYSLRLFLKTLNTRFVTASNPDFITSVDTLGHYKIALQKLRDKS